MKKKKIFLQNILRQIILVHCGQLHPELSAAGHRIAVQTCTFLTVERTKTEGKKKKQNTQRNIFKNFMNFNANRHLIFHITQFIKILVPMTK